MTTPIRRSNAPDSKEYLDTVAAKRSLHKFHIRKFAGVCTVCGINKPTIRASMCDSCFERNKNTSKIRKKNLLAEGKCFQCYSVHNRGTTLCAKCMEIQVNNFRLARKKNKEFIVEYFGGKCLECGEKDIRCLCLDHIDGDGFIDKKSDAGKKQGTPTWYAKLVRLIKSNNQLPRRLQLLCHNCHAKKGLIPWWYNDKTDTKI